MKNKFIPFFIFFPYTNKFNEAFVQRKNQQANRIYRYKGKGHVFPVYNGGVLYMQALIPNLPKVRRLFTPCTVRMKALNQQVRNRLRDKQLVLQFICLQ